MAGIAGIQKGNMNTLETMLASLRYRDSYETWTSPTQYTKIGCCKLETESRQQRQLSSHANGKFAILDGHLYNAPPHSLADTALLLSLYEEYGLQFAERLDGGFPCALPDSGEQVLSPDPLGLEPLYCGYQDGEFYFTSWTKALTEVAQEMKGFTPKVKAPDFETKEEAKKILVNLLTDQSGF
jgi:asparagine synthetase B (glutamine-hydrolysing)